jgi:putative ABC transport system substrate-binding protein
MRRRDLFVMLGSTVAAWPLKALAQTRLARVAILPWTDWRRLGIWQVFVDELRNRGWVEEKNLEFHVRPVEGHVERYLEFATELVALRPDVIVAGGGGGTRAVREKTNTIPIVMVGGSDPVKLGLIASLAHPGGNITGITGQGAAFYEKTFEFLLEAQPGIKRLVLVYAGASSLAKTILEEAAPRHGLFLEAIALKPAEFDAALAAVARSQPDALIVEDSPVSIPLSKNIAKFAVAHRLPSFSWNGGMTSNGLLMSFSPDPTELWRRAAVLVDKILKGDKPANIPVEQSTRFVLRLNQRTAEAIGLELPPSLVARADEVIE